MSNNADAKMAEYIADLPKQLERSLHMDYSFSTMYDKSYANVVISGFGGSGISGGILEVLASDQASIPVIIRRGYKIPAYVNENTLFIAVSYSGNTEEVLATVTQAENQRADIICITSGGLLAKRADEMDLGKLILPGGLPPRAAAGYLFAPIAMFLDKICLLKGTEEALKETVSILNNMWNSYGTSALADDNQAIRIAKELKNSIPVLWGTEISAVSAMRWKTQINENAKCPAYFNSFPELAHNEIVGFETPDSLLSQIVVILLCDKFARERETRRMEMAADIISEKVRRVIRIESFGESVLARICSLFYMGDLVSVYLAAEYEIDPTPVKVIDYLKKQMEAYP